VELIYEGKGKKVFQAKAHDQVVLYFKDDLTAFNALKKGSFSKKGELNCQIATLIFKSLHTKKIKTHFIETFSKNEMLVSKTKIIPLEVVVRNFSAGSFAQKFNVKDGEKLKEPLVEFYFKNDALKDPFVSEGQIVHFEWCTKGEIEVIKTEALKINQIISDLFSARKLKLIDFKIEFGKLENGDIILADEISPDCMRLWDSVTGERLDKDRFRLDLGDVGEGYQRIYNELAALKA